MSENATVLTVCAIYMLSMVCTGFYAKKRNRKTSDYLVAGRQLGVFMTAVTLAAVQIGVGIVLSSATNGYNGGVWYGIYYSIGCGGGLIVAGTLTAKKLRAQEGYVPLDYFALRYGESRVIRFWAWLSNVPSLLGIFIAQLLACGSVLSTFGLPFKWAVVLTAGVILLYCTIGGMWGVVLTDAIQTAIIVIAIPILCVTALIEYKAAGGSIAAIYSVPFVTPSTFTRFIYLTLPFLLSISVSYDAYARIQAAKDGKTAAHGCILGGILVIVVGLLCSTVGVASVKLFPGVNDGIFTIATTRLLHPVAAGIVVAAILSAAMSSANCVILSLGASFSRDLYNKFLHPEVENLDELSGSKFISQVTVLGGSIAGIYFAFHMTDILDAMIIFNYPYMGSLLVPLLGGLLWKGATRRGAFSAAIAGGIVGVGAFFIGIPSPIQGIINTDLALMTSYLVSAVVLVVVSLTDQKAAAGKSVMQ